MQTPCTQGKLLFNLKLLCDSLAEACMDLPCAHARTLAGRLLERSDGRTAGNARVGHAPCKFVCAGFLLDGIANVVYIGENVRRQRSCGKPCDAVEVVADVYFL